jgi:phospholipase/carboxylesterase
MIQHAQIIQQPQPTAVQLILLFHGFGGDTESMLPLGEQLAKAFPQAMVVAVTAHQPAESGRGFQWFKVSDITDENRPDRVAQAMPAFEASITHWQAHAGVTAEATALVGFSQGAIMALEATQRATPLASRVFAISGRYATLPSVAPGETMVHFLHGKADSVVPYSHTVDAAHTLRDLGGDITAEVLPFIGHEVHADFMTLVVSKLGSHLPRRLWDEALKASAESPTR